MNKTAKLLKRAAALVAAVALIFTFSSCGRKYDDDEIIAAAAELIEASYEINTIFFGEGLPTVDGAEDDIMKYREIAEDSPYHTKDEIKNAALEVYTSGYCEILFEKAFSGISVEMGDGSEVEEAAIVDARYVDYDGRMVMLPPKEGDVMLLNRTYDTSSIKVVMKKSSRADISVASFVDGEPAGDVVLTVIMTENGWRLEDPTY